VYLIIYANLCCVCSAQWWSVVSWGARPPTEIEQGFFSGFPGMQSGMFVILCSTIFNYCNFNRYVYTFTCGPYIQIFLVWPFMPKNRNFNLSVWLILYSNPLYLKCMKWINSTICCDCYTKINLFFTVLYYGPKRLVSPAVLRMPEPCMWSLYAEITFWRQTSHHLRGRRRRKFVCKLVLSHKYWAGNFM